MNCLITLHSAPGYWARIVVCCAADKEAAHMNDYMQALHARFCREPDRPELERALDDTYHALRENIARQDQELLLRAQDLEIDLREETSLASFIAGFRLGMGIAGEIEPYCFEDEEEKRAIERAKSRHPQSKN